MSIDINGMDFRAIDEIQPFELNVAIEEYTKKLDGLKSAVIKNGFETTTDEIHFFRNVKQEPLQNLIYSIELKKLLLKTQFLEKNRKNHLSQKMALRINRFFKNHQNFVTYVKTKSVYLDEYFFTRKYFKYNTKKQSSYYQDDALFSTSHDCLLAKIMAYEKLTSVLARDRNDPIRATRTSLNWTSSKTALTELVYALHYRKAINHGNVTVRDLASALEKTFNVQIGDVYRTYIELRKRKTDRTKFIDELSISLRENMEQLEL